MSFKKVNKFTIHHPSLISSAYLVDTSNANGQEEPLFDFDKDNISREETLEETGTTSEDVCTDLRCKGGEINQPTSMILL